MPTFTYSPTESVTIHPNGDVSVTDGATTTTFSRTGATKTTTKNPPDPAPPPPESALTQKQKPNGDLIHTFSDITKTPPVTVRITYKPNGDVEILTTIGEDRHLIDINGLTGVRRSKIWKDPDPEPPNWGKIETPKAPKGSSHGASSNGSKKKGKKARSSGKRRPVKKKSARKPSKKKPAKRKPAGKKKPAKKKRR